MKSQYSRRQFVKQAGAAGAAAAMISGFPSLHAADAGKKLVVGVVGLGRGMAHVNGHLSEPYTEVGYVCDLDPKRAEAAAAAAAKRQEKRPKIVKDFRQMLEDKSLDVVSIAMPNHWHAPATILACAAGKHVYVEKPGSHNAREGELMVAAARKHNRKVQMGNQRRSYPNMIEGIEKLRAGAIGRVLYARCWYNAARGSIGRGKPAPVPDWLDYSLWQGPAPERPFVDNLVHYNWHWRWHWGGGELANNGIHALDIARWALDVKYPRRVTFGGARYHFDDDQETPDTGVATFDFGDKGATWECSSCHTRKVDNLPFVAVYGDKGSLVFSGGDSYKIHDLDGKVVGQPEAAKGGRGEAVHFANFLDAIREGKPLNSEIESGQTSSLLCHLGNIAWRTGHTVHFDPQTRKIVGDPEAQKLWGREYRPGWEPKV